MKTPHDQEAEQIIDDIHRGFNLQEHTAYLASLLAARDELAEVKHECGELNRQVASGQYDCLKACVKERDQLRAEVEKWKLGCETNAECYKTAVTTVAEREHYKQFANIENRDHQRPQRRSENMTFLILAAIVTNLGIMPPIYAAIS